MTRIHTQQRWERLVDERFIEETIDVTIVENGEETRETTKEARRIVKFATDHAQAVMRYKGKDLDVKLSTCFSSTCKEMAVEEAERYAAYYEIDPDGPLTIEVEAWVETAEYIETPRRLPYRADEPVYKPVRPYGNAQESERVTVWVFGRGWVA